MRSTALMALLFAATLANYAADIWLPDVSPAPDMVGQEVLQ